MDNRGSEVSSVAGASTARPGKTRAGTPFFPSSAPGYLTRMVQMFAVISEYS